MKNNLSLFFTGLLFSLGLGISGMTQPQKVSGFLDVFGSWDPALMFVMIGAISVHALAYRIIRRRSHPLFSLTWQIPEKTQITKNLILGSVLFGIGWGLGGYCPGPSLTALASGQHRAFVFVGAMLAGMLIFKKLDQFLKFKQ